MVRELLFQEETEIPLPMPPGRQYEVIAAVLVAKAADSIRLAPHEDALTDVILLGHSLGGIIAGEVALKPAAAGDGRPRLHRLIGTVNFDTPFLGLHPRIIPTGIASLFRPKPKPAAPQRSASETRVQQSGNFDEADHISRASNDSRPYLSSNPSTTESDLLGGMPSAPLSQSSTLSLPVDDPNYNPPYDNDVQKPLRNGLASAWHFINKHSDDLFHAAINRVDSQMQFAACVADQTTLKSRYAALKALDDASRRNRSGVRFVNYYSACTGPPKRQKPPSPHQNGQLPGRLNDGTSNSFDGLDSLPLPASNVPTPLESPRISIEPTDDDDNTDPLHEEANIEDLSLTSTALAPENSSTSEPESRSDSVTSGQSHSSTAIPTTPSVPPPLPPRKPPPIPAPAPFPSPSPAIADLPPISPPPSAPDPFDLTLYPDKSTRKLLEKEHDRQTKAHKRALKDYDRAIKSRQKFIEKQEAALKKELDKQQQQQQQLSNEKTQQADTITAATATTKDASTKTKPQKEKKKKKKDEEEISSSSQLISAAGDDTPTTPTPTPASAQQQSDPPIKPIKDRKFCALPPKLADGSRDPCWVRLFMPDIDEVEAHCSLFDMDINSENDNDNVNERDSSSLDVGAVLSREEGRGRGSLSLSGQEVGQGQAQGQGRGRYVWFVGDVAERIVSWIS